MGREISIFGGTTARRSMALLACVALLYFAAGGSLFHQHTNGPDTACHICQALHMPALAGARLGPPPPPPAVPLHSSVGPPYSPSHSFSPHPARAPPPPPSNLVPPRHVISAP